MGNKATKAQLQADLASLRDQNEALRLENKLLLKGSNAPVRCGTLRVYAKSIRGEVIALDCGQRTLVREVAEHVRRSADTADRRLRLIFEKKTLAPGAEIGRAVGGKDGAIVLFDKAVPDEEPWDAAASSVAEVSIGLARSTADIQRGFCFVLAADATRGIVVPAKYSTNRCQYGTHRAAGLAQHYDHHHYDGIHLGKVMLERPLSVFHTRGAGRGTVHVLFGDEPGFFGLEVNCGKFVLGASCKVMRNDDHNHTGRRWLVNNDGTISPKKAKDLVLGFGRVTWDCWKDEPQKRAWEFLNLVVKTSPERLVAIALEG